LDRLLNKYAEQLGGMEEVTRRFDCAPAVVVEDEETEGLLQLLDGVTEWREPVKRGKRTYDDKVFFNSLKRQYAEKKSLSPRQVSALKKIIPRYAQQISEFEQIAEKYHLKLPKKKTEE
jgi:hypothetical protein